MKAYLVLCFLYMIFLETFAITPVNDTPTLSLDVAVPVTTNSVYLQKPSCYFNNVTDAACGNPNTCSVWLVAAQSSAISTFDSDKTLSNFVNLSPYPTAFNAGQKNYFVTPVDSLSKIPCPASGTPSYFLVGAAGACNTTNCDGVLPQGSTVSFKYLFVNSSNSLVAETNWSSNITLINAIDPNSLGSGYAGRSAAMVVITSILCLAAALLLLLLLIALILACCCRRGKTQSYDASHAHHASRQRDTSVIGSLRIPSYDVHHLKNPSPYDNPAYEQELKKRYTTTSTLPQTTTTIITTVHADSPDAINLQKM